MPADRFPILVRNGSVVVKIYRVTARTTADGWAYTVAWVGPNGREKETKADLGEAKELAEQKASFLSAGIEQGSSISRSDILELAEGRRIANDLGMPMLSALGEWAKARQLAGAAVIEACEAWASSRTAKIQRLTVEAAFKTFIEEKDAAKKQGTRTYLSKLTPAMTAFSGRPLDSITVGEWSKFLKRFRDPVTRNDVRKRIVTACRWAQANYHLSGDVRPEIEKTERAKEGLVKIGVLKPAEFEALLQFFREHHPRHLAALVLAGFCGVRAEEIHGKRADPSLRQVWEDIYIDRGFMSVTAAKENTPSNRIIHLCDAAVAWLRICPDESGNIKGRRRGYVCQANAITRIRDIAATHDMPVPDNGFRHSWISYRIALTGDKASTATEAGNSVREIDKHYRVPLPKYLGEEWFSIVPS
jgi:hypothetical protein